MTPSESYSKIFLMKQCPHCANPIKEGALTCPFCRADLTRQGRANRRFDGEANSLIGRGTNAIKKIPRSVGYIVILLMLAIGAFLAGRSMVETRGNSGAVTPWVEERTQELEEKGRQIRELDNQIVQLRKELEISSRQVSELQTRLEEATRALSFAQQKLKVAKQEVERPAVTPAPSPERATPKPIEPVSIPIPRPPAEPGTYEVIRPTPVFQEPSRSSRKMSTISTGTKVAVVRSAGDWLEVRSKHGNPPGFIHRDDAMFIERAD